MKWKIAPVIGAVLTSAALMAPAAQAGPAPASGWSAYELSNGGSEMSGSFAVEANGTVSGTLPAGTSKASPPEVPGRPEVAEAIRNATPAQSKGLREAPKRPAPGQAIDTDAAASRTAGKKSSSTGGRATTRASNPDEGCVHARSTITSGGITFWGYATGCARGDLLLRTWLRVGSTTVLGYKNKYCDGSTGCSQVNDPRTYTPSPRCNRVTNYADVLNRTTNGYSQAWQDHYPVAGC